MGDYSGEVRQKTGNEWVFETDRYPLKHGDILHYWIYVQHEQHGYQLHQMRFVYPSLCKNIKYFKTNLEHLKPKEKKFLF